MDVKEDIRGSEVLPSSVTRGIQKQIANSQEIQVDLNRQSVPDEVEYNIPLRVGMHHANGHLKDDGNSFIDFKNSKEPNLNNKESNIRGVQYMTRLQELLPSIFDEFEQGDLER